MSEVHPDDAVLWDFCEANKEALKIAHSLGFDSKVAFSLMQQIDDELENHNAYQMDELFSVDLTKLTSHVLSKNKVDKNLFSGWLFYVGALYLQANNPLAAAWK